MKSEQQLSDLTDDEYLALALRTLRLAGLLHIRGQHRQGVNILLEPSGDIVTVNLAIVPSGGGGRPVAEMSATKTTLAIRLAGGEA